MLRTDNKNHLQTPFAFQKFCFLQNDYLNVNVPSNFNSSGLYRLIAHRPWHNCSSRGGLSFGYCCGKIPLCFNREIKTEQQKMIQSENTERVLSNLSERLKESSFTALQSEKGRNNECIFIYFPPYRRP